MVLSARRDLYFRRACGLFRYIDSATEDPLFIRIVMGIWALPFLAIASYFFYDSAGCCQLSWVALIPIGIANMDRIACKHGQA